MVSVVVLVVVVVEVIDPCVKLGTTGTAYAAPEVLSNSSAVSILFIVKRQ
jgi:hypothetical protein